MGCPVLNLDVVDWMYVPIALNACFLSWFLTWHKLSTVPGMIAHTFVLYIHVQMLFPKISVMMARKFCANVFLRGLSRAGAMAEGLA